MNKKSRDESFFSQVGQQIVALRNAKKISQEQLADLTGFDLRQIGRVERGEVNTTINTIAIIAKALEVKPKDLFDFDLYRKDSDSYFRNFTFRPSTNIIS